MWIFLLPILAKTKLSGTSHQNGSANPLATKSSLKHYALQTLPSHITESYSHIIIVKINSVKGSNLEYPN
jgi:hypothetical protein